MTLGKGFEQILLPTLIVATLNGHSLETEIIEPKIQIIFHICIIFHW